jgi:hypothetical protein
VEPPLDDVALPSIDAKAPKIAPSKPPPGGGWTPSGWDASAALSLALRVLELLPLPWLAKLADSAVNGYKRFEFDTEWTLMNMLLRLLLDRVKSKQFHGRDWHSRSAIFVNFGKGL